MILLVGDVLLDVLLLPELREDGQPAGIIARGGGSAANTAAWVERLGHPASFVGCVGADPLGEMLTRELRDLGVKTHIRATISHETGCVAVEVTAEGERVMRSSRGANMELSPGDVFDAATSGLDWVHVTGYALLGHHAFKILEASAQVAADTGARLSFDPSATNLIQYFGAERLLEALQRAGVTLLLPNATEAGSLTGLSLPEDGAQMLAARFPLVIVKDGPNGAVWCDGGAPQPSPTEPRKPVDTTGAGDAFNAGVLVGLTQRKTPATACVRGHELARQVIGQYGGRPQPSRR